MELKRRLPVGGVDQNLDHFLGRLSDDQANGALTRVRTRLHEREGSLFIAQSQLLSFATSVDDLLEMQWPEEIPNAAPV
jgi:hypothetical protein